jgi:hypothetical protein
MLVDDGKPGFVCGQQLKQPNFKRNQTGSVSEMIIKSNHLNVSTSVPPVSTDLMYQRKITRSMSFFERF